MFRKITLIITCLNIAESLCQVQPVSDNEWNAVRKSAPVERHIEQSGSVYWVNPLIPESKPMMRESAQNCRNMENAIDMMVECKMVESEGDVHANQINQWETSHVESDIMPDWGEEQPVYAYYAPKQSRRQNISSTATKQVSPTLRPSEAEKKRRYARLYPNRNTALNRKEKEENGSTLSGLFKQLEIPNSGVLTVNASLPHKFSDRGFGYKAGLGVRFPKTYVSIMFGNVWKGIQKEKDVSFTGYGLNFHRNLKSNGLIRFSAGTGLGYWSLSENATFNNIVAEYYLMPNARIEIGKTAYLFWDVGAFVGTKVEPMMNLGISADLAKISL